MYDDYRITFSFRLLEIDASCNQLSSVPLELFMNPTVFRILLSSNQISFLPPVPAEEVSNPTFYSTFQWKCVKLKFLNCSRNKLMCVPEAMKGAVSLKRLSLSDNRMEVFDLTWNCPLVRYCLNVYINGKYSGRKQAPPPPRE